MRPMPPRRRTTLTWLALAVMALCLGPLQCILIPEGEFSGEREPNRPPTVQITGGVLADSADVGNLVRFRWLGADEDGVVRWFEWALDDTTSEGAWRRTVSAEQTVLLRATRAVQNGTSTDWHIFYLRAVDDQFAHSQLERRLFNATTIAPTSRLISPRPVDGARWAPILRFSWRGEDLDASGLDQRPAFYEIKHIEDPGVDVTDERAVRQLFEEAPNLLQVPLPEGLPPERLEVARRAWKRVPGTVTEVWLSDMAIGRRYLFGVRAIDEAGAVEQKFARNENWVAMWATPPHVRVCLHEAALGYHCCDTYTFADAWRVTVAPDQLVWFEWDVDAASYGTEPGPCTYGFDIPDPEDPAEPWREPNGLGGWAGWGMRGRTRVPVSFRAEQGPVHWFYLKVRDISNSPDCETRCLVEIRVQALAADKKLLIVDDQRRRPFSPCSDAVPSDDASEDAWRAGVLSSMADHLPPGEQAGSFNTFPNEATSPIADVPDDFFDILAEYQTVIWDCAAAEQTGLRPAVNDMVLSAYVGAGGNLLLTVWGGVVSTVTGRFSQYADDYCVPRPGDIGSEEAWNEFGFLWQHLHLRGPVDKPRGVEHDRNRRSLVRAVAVDPSYPDLALDLARWGTDPIHAGAERGDLFYECLVPHREEAGSPPWYERDDALHVLYTARCHTAIGHELNDRPVAWRIDPARGADPRPGYGRIVCLDFHPYYFDVNATEMAMSRALLWLLAGEE